MRKTVNTALKVLFSLLLAGIILWYMYRGMHWTEVREALDEDMSWGWMWASMPFGVLAQVFRALRWRQALEPMGERPRRLTCVHAVFLSYASSLVVPRVGEILRCGVLRKWEGTGFARSVGTVVTERVVDMALILLISAVAVMSQMGVFLDFAQRTGIGMDSLMARFPGGALLLAGVAAVCVLGVCVWLLRRSHIARIARKAMGEMVDGLFSIRHIRHAWLFIAYSLGIWAAYYMHFYVTFFCFPATSGLGHMAALLAFVVGSFAVIVPTPNGAGPWHFAIKVALMLYGVEATAAAMFALIVHSLQTLLVLLLGVYAAVALMLTTRRGGEEEAVTSASRGSAGE